MSIRRILFFYLSMGLFGRACYQLAWEADLRDRLLESPWQSLGLLAMAMITIAFVIWSVISPNGWRTFITFVLGVASALWAQDLLDGVSWGQIGLLAFIFVLFNLLMYCTTWDYIFGDGSHMSMSRIASRLASPTSTTQQAPATTSVTTPPAASPSAPPPPPAPPATQATQAP